MPLPIDCYCGYSMITFSWKPSEQPPSAPSARNKHSHPPSSSLTKRNPNTRNHSRNLSSTNTTINCVIKSRFCSLESVSPNIMFVQSMNLNWYIIGSRFLPTVVDLLLRYLWNWLIPSRQMYNFFKEIWLTINKNSNTLLPLTNKKASPKKKNNHKKTKDKTR